MGTRKCLGLQGSGGDGNTGWVHWTHTSPMVPPAEIASRVGNTLKVRINPDSKCVLARTAGGCRHAAVAGSVEQTSAPGTCSA
jgi:hypothetical protein